MGLFDSDPQKAAQMMLAAGLLSGKGSFNSILGRSMMGAQDQFAQSTQQGLIEKMRKQQLEEAERASRQRQTDTDQFRSQFQNPLGMLGGGASPDAVMQAIQLQHALNPKKPAPIKGGPGDTFFDPETMKPLASVPNAPDKEAVSPVGKLVAEMQQLPPGHPMRSVYEQAIKKATTHAPGTSVSVNTGQKGFDNTLKLRGDFRSEPVYKAFQEMQAAHSQISQGLSAASPAGDLIGATKFMKLIDPGSVVRESELFLAMSATGLLDRAANYADQIIKGVKLNPAQRKDFKALADKLFQESQRQYTAKRQEYIGISERNQLNTVDVVGPDQATPTQAPQILRFDAQGNPIR